MVRCKMHFGEINEENLAISVFMAQLAIYLRKLWRVFVCECVSAIFCVSSSGLAPNALHDKLPLV